MSATVAPAAHPDPRAEYIAGLRALADALEANPDLRPASRRRSSG